MPARSIARHGEGRTALGKAAKRYEADFLSDHVYHAQMEPLNALASVNQAGDAVEIWDWTAARTRRPASRGGA